MKSSAGLLRPVARSRKAWAVALTATFGLTSLVELPVLADQLPPLPQPLANATPTPVPPRPTQPPPPPPPPPPAASQPAAPPSSQPAVKAQQAPPAGPPPLTINHVPLKCVVTQSLPIVDAKVAPEQDHSRSYVYFRAANVKSGFYYTLMQGPPTSLVGELPRPLPGTEAVEYYLRSINKVDRRKETPHYEPKVEAASTCPVSDKKKGALTVGLTEEGQSPVPPGFNKEDIVGVVLLSGEVVTLAAALKASGGAAGASAGGTGGAAGTGGTAGAASGTGAAAGTAGAAGAGAAAGTGAAATGGGISTGVLIAGGAVAVGAGVAIAASSGGGKDNTPVPTATAAPSSTPTRTATPTPSPTVSATATRTPIAPLQFVEVDVNWSGLDDVTLQLQDAGGAAVGQTFAPAPCGSTASRTARVVLQRSGSLSGSYSAVLTGVRCPSGTASSVTAVFSAFTAQGPLTSSCSSFVAVPIGGSQRCSIVVP